MNDFTLLINSDVGVGSNNSSKEYQFDFLKHKEGYYKVNFSFVSQDVDVDPLKIGLLYSNLGKSNTCVADATDFHKNTEFLGIIFPQAFSSISGNLAVSHSDNPKTVLYRPNRTTFTVQLRDQVGNLFQDNNGVYPSYILVLNFEFIEE